MLYLNQFIRNIGEYLQKRGVAYFVMYIYIQVFQPFGQVLLLISIGIANFLSFTITSM